MKKFLIIFTVLAFVSCKDDKSTKDDQQKEAQKPAGNDFFRVTLDLIAKKDDSFHIFYTEDGSQDFKEENSVWVEFKGSDNGQKLNFDLPTGVMPTQLRIDFGVNKAQEDVQINSMEMSYHGNTALISGPQFFTVFRPNEASTVFDVPGQKVKKLVVPGKESVNPSVYQLEALNAEIEKVLR
jgi:hypothetical protein